MYQLFMYQLFIYLFFHWSCIFMDDYLKVIFILIGFVL